MHTNTTFTSRQAVGAKVMAGTNRKGFHFFDLPRELRNAIYAGATAPSTTPMTLHSNTAIHITHSMRPEMRLVCKRLQDEYEEEAFHECEVYLWLCTDMDVDIVCVAQRLPKMYRGLRSIKLRISAVHADRKELDDLLSKDPASVGVLARFGC